MTDDRNDGSADAVPGPVLRELARGLGLLFRDIHLLAGDEVAEGLVERVEAHLGADPRGLPVVSHEFPQYQLVDVQVALEAWNDLGSDRHTDVVGVSGDQRRFHPFSELLAGGHRIGVGVGPVEYMDIADSPDSTRSCVRFGIFLLRDADRRAAVLLRGADPHGPMQQAMVEIVAGDAGFGRQVLGDLRRLAVERSVLRGQVVALGPGEGQQYGGMRFLRRPHLRRDELVLPDGTLAQIERHVIGIAAHGRRLRAAGQHLKRGVLLYGPPGTGKTHTVRYLLSQLTTVTTFVLSGQAFQFVGEACGLARLLQPSMVVLEDVDLVAGERSFGPIGSNPLLFEVLNQIDGLGDDVDVTFLLTTNRVDILERALAERPGRVDAAVEIAAPDEEGRRRLFRLYGDRLGVAELSDVQLAGAVAATQGRTATYLREVVRRAALLAAERQSTDQLRADGEALAAAAEELLDDRAALTRALLGAAQQPDAEPPNPPPAGAGYQMTPMFRPGRPSLGTMRHVGTWGSGGQGPPTPFGSDEP